MVSKSAKKGFWKYLLSLLVLIIGAGGLLTYDLYIEPYVFSKTVVKVKAADNGVSINHILKETDIYLEKVPTSQLPTGYIEDKQLVIGKATVASLTNGMILTETLIDINDISPGPNEGIFPIPKSSIFSINGTLRSRDFVSIYLVAPSTISSEDRLPSYEEAFIERAKVAYVRAEDNNDVTDSMDGNTNSRETSTGKVSYPELILDVEKGKELRKKLEQGYLLWIIRIP